VCRQPPELQAVLLMAQQGGHQQLLTPLDFSFREVLVPLPLARHLRASVPSAEYRQQPAVRRYFFERVTAPFALASNQVPVLPEKPATAPLQLQEQPRVSERVA
jgi:hypothetical protein